ncbi:MAG: hypothetical protein ACK6BC_14785 [Cyanobacteriota bacterium]
MTLTLTKEERSQLLGGPLAAAMAVMALDLGLFSTAQEAFALGKELSTAATRYATNPLITSLLDPEVIKHGITQEHFFTAEDIRAGTVLDRALEKVDQAMTLAQAKADASTAREFARLIVDGCVVVAEAAGKGLFGSGEKVTPEEKAA